MFNSVAVEKNMSYWAFDRYISTTYPWILNPEKIKGITMFGCFSIVKLSLMAFTEIKNALYLDCFVACDATSLLYLFW